MAPCWPSAWLVVWSLWEVKPWRSSSASRGGTPSGASCSSRTPPHRPERPPSQARAGGPTLWLTPPRRTRTYWSWAAGTRLTPSTSKLYHEYAVFNLYVAALMIFLYQSSNGFGEIGVWAISEVLPMQHQFRLQPDDENNLPGKG